MGFIGEYSATMDPKGRFLLPVDVKKQITETEQSKFIINIGFEECLELYTLENWKPVYEKILKLNDFDPKQREFKRYFTSKARNIELDGAGRLLLAKDHIDYAHLDKEIVLVGSFNKVEIWDRKRYEDLFRSYTPEKYSEIARIVMGGEPEKGNLNA